MNDLCPLRIFVIDDDPIFCQIDRGGTEGRRALRLFKNLAVYSLSEIRRKSPNCVLVDL